MDRAFGHGVHDWSEEGIDEEEEDPIALRRRRRSLRRRTPSPSPDLDPTRTSTARSPSPPPRPWLNWIFAARSPSRLRGGQSTGILSARPEPPPSRNPVAQSVRTRRRAARSPAATDGGSSGAGAAADGDPGGAKGRISLLRGWSTRLFGARGGGEEDFSFPPLEPPPNVVDAAEVLDLFVGAAQTPRTTNARREFLDATMGGATAARTEKMKKELLLNRRVVDLMGLEMWLRREEALAELAWFTELCSGGEKKMVMAPPLELFECAFQAVENASSDELHRGANARRFWVGSVAVPEFFFCPVSDKIMENPVIVTSGKTVDRSHLVKWWRKHKRVCPVTGDALTHSVFIPDLLIATCISQWRRENSITDLTTTTATARDQPPAISTEEEALFMEVTLLAESPRSSMEALLRLHDLIHQENQRSCSYLHLLGHSSGTMAKLAGILPETCLDPDPELDDIILKIMAKVASYGPNKDVLGDDRYIIPVLIARAVLGPVSTRSKCAEILGVLADDNYYNKIKIGELGAFAPLMELLSMGDMDVKRTAAMAIASLCEAEENLSRFVREGVADAAISLLREHGLVDEAYSMLVQAEGFQLAMVDAMEKLLSFGRDDMCEKMIDRLWVTFMRSEPGRRRRTSFSPWLASSLAAGAGKKEEFAGNGDAVHAMKDVEAVVSWLQMRAYYPRTYRYRH